MGLDFYRPNVLLQDNNKVLAQYGAAQAAAKNVIKTGILPTKKQISIFSLSI